MSKTKYRLSFQETIISITSYFFIVLVISYLFYDSLTPVLLAIPFFPVFFKYQKSIYEKRHMNNIRIQFSEMLCSISTALSAGFSVENAFKTSLSDVEKMFGKQCEIYSELETIVNGFFVNESLENSLRAFSEIAGVDEIRDFTVIFTEALKNGGEFTNIIANAVTLIKQKNETEKEINSILKGKMLEQKVMSFMPFMIIGYMRVSNGDFMSSLYHNVAGISVMTICLAIYFVALFLSLRITNIEV